MWTCTLSLDSTKRLQSEYVQFPEHSKTFLTCWLQSDFLNNVINTHVYSDQLESCIAATYHHATMVQSTNSNDTLLQLDMVTLLLEDTAISISLAQVYFCTKQTASYYSCRAYKTLNSLWITPWIWTFCCKVIIFHSCSKLNQ